MNSSRESEDSTSQSDPPATGSTDAPESEDKAATASEPTDATEAEDEDSAAAEGEACESETTTPEDKLRGTLIGEFLGISHEKSGPITAQEKAKLLYEHCLTSKKKVTELVHNLYIIAEHYSESSRPVDIENPTVINGIPPFFETLSPRQKANYCYDQVTEALSLEAFPVTVESLKATRRKDPNDAWSSHAGRFVRRVALYVTLSLFAMAGLWKVGAFDSVHAQWVAFGCLGALVHLLNHALTTTRMQTFEISEERKIWPRLLLGGLFGFIVPWLLAQAGLPTGVENISGGSIAAFFGGYSVRFATGLLERLLAALVPESPPNA